MPISIEKKIVGYELAPKAASTPATTGPVTAITPSHTDIDRRIVLKPAAGVAEASLRWPKRPQSVNGFESWTSGFITAPAGKFALSISIYRNGSVMPFEVFALGVEQPSCSSEICRLLSKVLQTADPAFIAFHLDALKNAVEAPFPLTLPFSGKAIEVGSVGAAIATIVEAYARHIGYLHDGSHTLPSPMLDALASKREPKTEGQGGVCHFEDVLNETTGELFKVVIPEALLENGRVFPYGCWLAGRRAPAESEAMCKLISLFMRHSDPRWTAIALETLRDHRPSRTENADFWAPVPRTDKRRNYASSWQYIAEVLLARYRQLGILDEHGRPVVQAGLFEHEPTLDFVPVVTAPKGARCPSCGEATLRREAGCDTCHSCSYSRCG